MVAVAVAVVVACLHLDHQHGIVCSVMLGGSLPKC